MKNPDQPQSWVSAYFSFQTVWENIGCKTSHYDVFPGKKQNKKKNESKSEEEKYAEGSVPIKIQQISQ